MKIILIIKRPEVKAVNIGKAVSIAKGHGIFSTMLKVMKYYEPCKINF